MAQSTLKVIVTAPHVVLDDAGHQLVPGLVYDVKDAPVIQQLLGDDLLRLVPAREAEAEEAPAPKPAKTTKDSASAEVNPS